MLPLTQNAKDKICIYGIEEKEVEAGLDYGIYSRSINKLLHRLPANAIAAFHMQGEPAYNTGATAHSVGQMALKLPHVKFILNHMGDFAIKGMKPSNYYYPGLYSAFTHKYAYSRACIGACVEYSNLSHNIWLETSILIKHKLEFVKQARYWCLGSDYPFMRKDDFFKQQEQILVKSMSQEALDKSYADTLHWLSADWKDLIKEHIAVMGYKDNMEAFEYPSVSKGDIKL